MDPKRTTRPPAGYQDLSLGGYREGVEEAFDRVEREGFLGRMGRKDAGLWKTGAREQALILDSLGWLRAPGILLEGAGELRDFAGRVREEGFESVLLMGMGGSSLCPEVLARTFDPAPGFPRLCVLDSTVPARIRELEAQVDLARTLFVVASKSGTTTEPLMFQQYFLHQVSRVRPDPGQSFVAITDPGSQLEALAREHGFRRTFLNMADIGGRYSALSYFGMVPASLMGLDIEELLARADSLCPDGGVPDDHPAARLGAALGWLALQGRDKVTLVLSPPLESLGPWIEQLLAESTGKEGRGLIPVAQEPLGDPDCYGRDRVFVQIRTSDGRDPPAEGRLQALQEAGHPVIRQVLEDPLSLGREFLVWEIATAVAGVFLEINPFDQPNVQESKDNTRRLLELSGSGKELPPQRLLAKDRNCAIYGEAAPAHPRPRGDRNVVDLFTDHLASIRPGDYLALLAYLPETPEVARLLEGMRLCIRDRFRVATTLGFGPRYLHSTGQLHKGGGGGGVFLQITAPDRDDLPIPGQPFSFGILKQAQALGDFESLARRGRRVLRFDAGPDLVDGLEFLKLGLEAAAGSIPRSPGGVDE